MRVLATLSNMPDVADMSDEELIREWNETKMMTAGLLPGVEPPMYPLGQQKRHSEAEAELLRRGFVETPPGWWERPSEAEA